MKTHKRQFHVTVTVMSIVGLLVAATVGYVVWFAYHSAHNANISLRSANKVSQDIPQLPQITTFSECQKAPKSKTLETYPEQCVTAAGKKFIDTTQPKYLVIKEWGVELPYAGDDTFTYQISAQASNSVIVVSAQLATTYGCTTYGAGVIVRNRASDRAYPADASNAATVAQIYATHPGEYMKLGSYYYRFTHDQAECGNATVQAQNTANVTLQSALLGIRAIN